MAIISYKCPNCDGELIFEPSTQKYKCEYCGSLFSQEELDAMKPAEGSERIDGGAQASEEKTGEETGETAAAGAVIYNCPSCGAQIVTDDTTAATFCYYCHNPVVLGGRLEGKYLPDKIIPFAVTREAAEKGFGEYISKKKFVPKAFFSKKQIESMTGVYFPYWIYDARLEGSMQAEGRNIRVWRSGETEFTETKFYNVQREGEVELSNLSENALKKANAKLAKNMLPYDFSKMKKFKTGYLSGFLAERRDIEKQEVEGKMQQEMRESAERLLRETISGYNSVSVRNTRIVPKKENWSYVLFPVWTLTYKAKNGKIYYYSMNGQTGKVSGELPIDYARVTIVSAVCAAAALALALIGGFFL